MLGVCGGLQMLGRAIADPHGVEGAAEGLGLLPVRTALGREKVRRRVQARFGALETPWRALSGLEVAGYEIRHGTTSGAGAVLGDDLGFASGGVLGVSVHGLFEDAGFTRAVVGAAPERSLDEELDRLADAVAPHLDVDALLEVVA